MARIRAQVTLDRRGGLPADAITNTYHFEDDSGFSSDGGISVNGPGLVTRLQTFYNTLGGFMLGAGLIGTGVVRLYNMSDVKPRVPRLETGINFQPNAGGTPLPGEVALCLSFDAEKVSGQSQARRRGRVFLGTLSTSVFTVPGVDTPEPRPKAQTITDLLAAAHTMARGGSGAFRLAVFSPTQSVTAADQDLAWNDVVRVSVDDAFDTIRSRGTRPTKRAFTPLGGAFAPQNNL